MSSASPNMSLKIESVRSMEPISAKQEKGLKCKECSYVTSERSNLLRHIKGVHEKIADFKCDQCSFHTSYRDSLNRHKKMVHGIKLAPDKTIDPPERRTNDEVQNVKQEVESDESEGEADIIESSNVGEPAENANIQGQVTKKRHKCNMCQYEAGFPAHLRDHIKYIHERSFDVPCSKCPKAFIMERDLTKHMKLWHVRIQQNCGQCSHVAQDKYEFKEHMKSHYDEQCLQCDYRCMSKKTLTSHMRIHASKTTELQGQKSKDKIDDDGDTRNIKVEADNRESGSDDDLIESNNGGEPISITSEAVEKRHQRKADDPSHLNLHIKHVLEKTKGLRCSKCPKAFTINWELTRHLKVMHSRIMRNCELCNHVAQDKYEFMNHMKSHANEQCSLCSHKSMTKKALWQHVRRTHKTAQNGADQISEIPTNLTANKPAMPFTMLCEVCSMKFRFRFALTRHMKVMHPDFKMEMGAKNENMDTYKKLQCDLCPYSTDKRVNLQNHIGLIHKRIKDKKCPMCQALFKEGKNLRKHHESMHLDRKMRCKHCSAVAGSKYEFMEHLKSHFTEECDQCSFRCRTRKAMGVHRKRHHDTKESSEQDLEIKKEDVTNKTVQLLNSFVSKMTEDKKNHQCSLCPYSNNRQGKLRRHTIQMHSDMKITCTLCNIVATNKHEYKEHMKSHAGQKCTFCNYKCFTKQALKCHVKAYHEAKDPRNTESEGFTKRKERVVENMTEKELVDETAINHHCTLCPYSTTKRRDLKRHTINMHDVVKDKQCQKCPMMFKYQFSLDDHDKRMHSDVEISCKHCTSVARNKYEHMEHMKSHATKQCSICDYKCFKGDNLKRHVRSNHETKEALKDISKQNARSTTNESEELPLFPNGQGVKVTAKKYQCSLCPYSANKRKNLQLHTSRVHDAVKDKKCPRCPTLFRREETLKDHVRSMHSSFSIICKHCTSVSRDKYEHMEHKKSHATKYCSLCEYKCFKSDTLKRHVRNNHETKEPDVQLSQDETEGVAIKTESLMTHLKEARPKSENMVTKKHKCGVCPYSGSKKENLTNHTTLMHSNMNIKCKHCDVVAKNKYEFYKHVKSHATQQCSLCSHKCITKKALWSHVNRHHKTMDPDIQAPDDETEGITNKMDGSMRFIKEAEHAEVREKKKKHQCGLCPYAANKKEHFKSHTTLMHSKMPFTCKRCNAVSESKYESLQHIKFHATQKCSHCNYKCFMKKNMRIHMRRYHNTMEQTDMTSKGKLKCSLCPFVTKKMRNLKSHKHTVHELVKDKQCPKCPMLFKCEKSVESHMNLMHSGRKINCQHCNEVSDSKYENMEHMKSHATQQCLSCDYKCFSSKALRVHIRRNHETKKPGVQSTLITMDTEDISKKHRKCDLCPFVAKSNEKLKNHKRCVHEMKKVNQCPKCPVSFKGAADLRRHIKGVHDKLKDNLCPKCPWAFSHISDLNKHIKNSHQNGNVACKRCTYVAEDNYDYIEHRKSHCNVPCPICPKKCLSKDSLRDHLKNTHKTSITEIQESNDKHNDSGFINEHSMSPTTKEDHNDGEDSIENLDNGEETMEGTDKTESESRCKLCGFDAPDFRVLSEHLMTAHMS